MAKRILSNLLEKIGNEIHDVSYVDASGTIRPITKDEALAREVWKRALGYEEETTNADGNMQHRVHPPDPKMQQFLIERREGKNIEIQEERTAKLLDRVSEIAKNQLNAAAEKIAEENDVGSEEI